MPVPLVPSAIPWPYNWCFKRVKVDVRVHQSSNHLSPTPCIPTSLTVIDHSC
ncbi:hypothetical protein P692DRAFT_201798424 [Suillus brevipes Sb2]|nr:hypothetical protein P692DRAFT_201798424 [Suillus brevipes Sb2]